MKHPGKHRTLVNCLISAALLFSTACSSGNSDPGNARNAGESPAMEEDRSADGNWTFDETVTLSAPSADKVYDGEPLTAAPDMLVEGLPGDFSADVTVEGSQTDAGTSENAIIQYVIRNEAGEDVTDHFSVIHTVNGTLTVEPAPITIWTGSAAKVYDGTPLTNAQAGIKSDDNPAVAAEGISVRATGSRATVGQSLNTYEIDWGTGKPENYVITEELGTLTVTAKTAARTNQPAAPVYYPVYQDTPPATPDNKPDQPTQTDEPEPTVEPDNNPDPPVEPEVREITITADSGSKVYDGEALFVDTYAVSGLPSGYTCTAVCTGSQTDADTSDNVISSYTVYDEAGQDVTGEFTVNTVNGTLTVDPVEVVLISECRYAEAAQIGIIRYLLKVQVNNVDTAYFTVEQADENRWRLSFSWGDKTDVHIAVVTDDTSYAITPAYDFVSGSQGNYSIQTVDQEGRLDANRVQFDEAAMTIRFPAYNNEEYKLIRGTAGDVWAIIKDKYDRMASEPEFDIQEAIRALLLSMGFI
ncbi:MAG: hypothetical protein IKE68_04330 [Solobacterium sp.]|nr:hypothetical protein [Solobacterium sp.]